MQQRKLGKNGPSVSAIGYGCMSLSPGHYGESIERSEAINLIHTIYNEFNVNFFDTADMYGRGHNEELLSEALATFRKKIILATKCGIVINNDNSLEINSSKKYIKQACNASLKRLKTDYIDLYYMHRYNTKTPIEEVAEAMLELINEGKIHYVGLSEVNPDIIRKAHDILGDKLVAIQTEYSIRNREAGDITLPICKELGISFVAYSPLGRGFLTGSLTNNKSFGQSEIYDFRNDLPQFKEGNFEQNLPLVKAIHELAKQKNCTNSQLCLAWLLAQGNEMIPIPGTTKLAHFKENLKALDVNLSTGDLNTLSEIYKTHPQIGLRFPAIFMEWACK